MNNFFIKKARWPLGCLLFLSCCTTQPAYQELIITRNDSIQNQKKIENAFMQISHFSNLVQNGDLVTRTGNDFTSETLRTMNQRDKTYSHCGIASIENDSIFIYHALGGEWNPDQKILRQPIREFAEPYSNRGIGLYRFSISPGDNSRLVKTIRQFYTKGIMFDMNFDLQTDDHMYCAEFVAKSFTRSTENKISFRPSFISGFEFIGVDDLFLHPHCKNVEQLVYK